jgi:hypothetical protein
VFPNELLLLVPVEVPCPGLPELPPLDMEADKLVPGPPPMTLLKPPAVFDGPLLDVEADMPGLLIWDIVLPLGLEVMLVIPPGPVVVVVLPPGPEFMDVMPTGPKENVGAEIP